MLFYLVGPFMVTGMSKLEPFIALGVAAVWGLYGAAYFVLASKSKGQSILVTKNAYSARRSACTIERCSSCGDFRLRSASLSGITDLASAAVAEITGEPFVH